MENVLSAHMLAKKYGAKTALKGVNLELPQGKIVGLLGPNGSGKTTFLKLCAGLLSPTGGNVSVCGKPVGTETRSLVSYLPDRTYFNNRQRISEQLEFFQDFYEDFDRERATDMLNRLGISLDSRFGTLSKGAREKVQLVMVMSRRARLYLLDEPIGGVDPAARDYILNTIIQNYDPTATVVISTHLISDVESVLDEFVFLNNGEVVRQGTVDEVREETGKSIDELFREAFACLPSC